MSRPKRKSTTLETARQRLAGLKQISPKPDFGSALTLEGYETEVKGFGVDLDAYNSNIVALDQLTNRLDAREQVLSDLNQRILAAVLAHFGPDSNEYDLAGGQRRSARKKSVRTQKPQADLKPAA